MVHAVEISTDVKSAIQQVVKHETLARYHWWYTIRNKRHELHDVSAKQCNNVQNSN